MPAIKTSRWTSSLLIAAVAAVMFTGGASRVKAEEPADYTVIDGKVDQDTYDGYIVYTRSCQGCHGPDGLGSTFAPSLVQAAQRRTFTEFAQTIAQGLQFQPGKVMPSFSDDMYVMSHITQIWSYLQARADGELGRGRPDVIEDKKEDSQG